ncbi:DNA repair protein RecN [Parvularcula lutaonensis]|uniref:DNA repair protein RecN n=1 Tax=Parvularcula lutaonensis TaxID=491923 RepID=A0ABV7MG88_9PROT|nr:DNA repair protein RecN [Parvularcula lutaonensis]GGY53923.1 DNA repair protein RecN [Parvularcula lutaonensis]
MLIELTIQDIVLIDRLTLRLGGGLSALTGETGAGKSILLDSLGLAVGGKAEKGLVRAGADRGVVSAVFDVGESHPVWALLDEAGVPAEDDLIILRRVQNADGKSRAFVNDQTVPVSVLRRIGQSLIEVHGQHESQGFLDQSVHRTLLDDYAGLTKQLSATRTAWRDLKAIRQEIAEREAQQDAAIREADYLRFVADELEKLDPQPGEEAELAEKRAKLMAAEKVSEDLSSAIAALGDDGLEAKVSSAAGRIERAASRLDEDAAEPLTKATARLDAALSEFAEARSALLDAAEAFVRDENALDETEERLFALRAAGRKYGRAPDLLHAYAEEVRRQLELLDEGEASFGELRAREKMAAETYRKVAEELSAKRQKAAGKFSKAVMAELKPLKLDKAQFKVVVDPNPDQQGEGGFDRVAFEVSTNPGAPFGPLKQIASGGELSRFVLALKTILTAKDGRSVIVFDEVDSGVGGAVADAIGERLAQIAGDAQTLVVTHSPQVAARARSHFKVEKAGKKTVKTDVRLLSDDERREEIARMLSGATVTDEARAAATKLLDAGRADQAA